MTLQRLFFSTVGETFPHFHYCAVRNYLKRPFQKDGSDEEAVSNTLRVHLPSSYGVPKK